jgi:hypothetical protein
VNHQTPERTLYFQDFLEVIQLQGHETFPSEGNSSGKVGGPVRDPVLVMTVICVVLKTKGCEVRVLAATPLLNMPHQTGLGALPQHSMKVSWSLASKPTEFKHISRWRNRN